MFDIDDSGKISMQELKMVLGSKNLIKTVLKRRTHTGTEMINIGKT